jgi:pyruvate,orthophosphate dikinase
MGMVSGNQAGGGATVFFTRNPYTHEPIIFGETREQASGSDLASGRKSGRPLSRMQVTTGQQSLEELDPGLYQLHQDLARAIEDAFDGLPQEVEVTFTRDAKGRPMLYVLQTRRMEYSEKLIDTFDEICRMESRVIGRGIGSSGGALSGVASFADSPGKAELLKRSSGMPVILIRRTANTDDVSLMPIIGGIITASGGVTSHAAVLAQKFNIAAVVACADMKVVVDEQGRPYAEIGKSRVQEGTAISIDGATGLVFSGTCFRAGQNIEKKNVSGEQ